MPEIRVEAGIFRHYRSGPLWIRYTSNGKQHKEPTKTSNVAHARRLLAKRRTEVWEGRFNADAIKAHGNTLGVLRDRWVKHAESVGLASIATQRKRFNTILEIVGARKPIAVLTASDIDRLMTELEKRNTRFGRPHSCASINRHVELLRTALNFALDEHMVARLPVTFAGRSQRRTRKGIKLHVEHNERDRLWTDDEYRRVKAAAEGDVALAVILGHETGMRLGEIVALEWRWTDYAKQTITLPAEVTKTKRGRLVPLTIEATRALKGWSHTTHARVFPTLKSSNSISPRISRVIRKLGIVDLHFHDLRHSFATRLRRAGFDHVTIMAILGHTDPKTARRYQTVDGSDVANVISLLNARRPRVA